MDGNILESGKEKLRIQKYPVTCGRALFCTKKKKKLRLFTCSNQSQFVFVLLDKTDFPFL